MMNVSDIVESNGKTVKQNNMEQSHTIPLGSLVEILGSENDDDTGLRLFVVHHGRDCDGTPLYGLSLKKDAKEEMDKRQKQVATLPDGQDYQIAKMFYYMAQGSILFNYSAGSLKVIK
ncbi:hypothetical protein [Serratia sp. Se-RSBMAAmG]|uniref:hypothetical protein n=1 Tax=Serratia sp. Se-RSBMAAmG TaxID=3043305 RepID=UPI0024AF3A6C|nr:hypothetical protein [Serratia sp. Se-RSBMAAmG]MDI6977294.1 hypothetical protein [Serratia sp. Se-RSBMAAmG]